MTVDEFYEGHHWLARAYIRAEKRRRQMSSYESYRQGAYTYEAITRCAPLFNPFAKDNKPTKWLDRPFEDMGRACDSESSIGDDRTSEGGNAGGRRFMEQFMIAHNATLARDVSKRQEDDSSSEQ